MCDLNEARHAAIAEHVRELEALRAAGICYFCGERFQPEEHNSLYGHDACAEESERESDRLWREELIASVPPGTRFDLAGGAACD